MILREIQYPLVVFEPRTGFHHHGSRDSQKAAPSRTTAQANKHGTGRYRGRAKARPEDGPDRKSGYANPRIRRGAAPNKPPPAIASKPPPRHLSITFVSRGDAKP